MTTNIAPEIIQISDKISQSRNCDVLAFNFGIEPGFEMYFIEKLKKFKSKKQNLLFCLTTEGGDPDTAYRMARHLQDTYSTITALIVGWCKSAGTLMSVAANEIIMSEYGELGPLDIQIMKTDELWERSSGLAVEAAFEKLQREQFSLFINNLFDIKEKSRGRITFRTAADIAAQMAIGVTAPIFEKLDPLGIGEDHRSSRVAEEYAIRLNMRGANLRQDQRVDGLEMLLRGYPSHGFVVDRKEAGNLFKRVSSPSGDILDLVLALMATMTVPRNSLRNQVPFLEFLNAETQSAKSKGPAAPIKGRGRRSSAKIPGNAGSKPKDLPGSLQAGSGTKRRSDQASGNGRG